LNQLLRNPFVYRLLTAFFIFSILVFAAGLNWVLVSLWISANSVIYLLHREESSGAPVRDLLFILALSFMLAFGAAWESDSLYLSAAMKSLDFVQVVLISAIVVLYFTATAVALARISASWNRKFIRYWFIFSVSGLISILLFFLTLPLFGFHPGVSLATWIKVTLAYLVLAPILLFLMEYIEKSWIQLSWSEKREPLFVVSSALLTALAFPQADLPMLRGFSLWPWFSLIPYFYILAKKSDWKQKLLHTFLWEFFYTIFLLYWIKDFADLGPLFLALILPAYRIAGMLSVEWVAQRSHPLVGAFSRASGFIFADALRTYGFLAFPWGFLGYTQTDWPGLHMISRVGGIWLVSFIVVFHNSLIAVYLDSLKSSTFKKFIATTGAIVYLLYAAVILATATFFSMKIPEVDPELVHANQKKNFIIVQPAFDPWGGWFRNRMDYFEILRYWTDKGMRSDTDFILWTESSTLERFTLYASQNRSNPFLDRFRELVLRHGKPLLTGGVDAQPIIEKNRVRFRDYNSAVFFDGSAQIVATYRKNQLVPFGEWFPYENFFPGARSILDSYGGSSWSPGRSLQLMQSPQTGTFGPLICYEGIFFRQVRDYVNQGAAYLVNITNLMWTHTYAGHIQHAQMAQTRAMEQDRYFIRAANDGLSCVIDPYGRIIKSLPLFERGVLNATVDIAPREKTWYARWGDLFLYLLLAAQVLFGIIKLIQNKRFRNRKQGN